jgi:hypothetical protein
MIFCERKRNLLPIYAQKFKTLGNLKKLKIEFGLGQTQPGNEQDRFSVFSQLTGLKALNLKNSLLKDSDFAFVSGQSSPPL